MKNLFYLVLCWSITTSVFAAQWPTGSWQAQVDGELTTIDLTMVADNGINGAIKSTNEASSLIFFEFTSDAKNYAQAQQNQQFALKLTSFGDLILEITPSDGGKPVNAFLKPVTSPIKNLADYPTPQAIADLPSADVWLNYFESDLWKFWGTDDALSFSSFRCNNGQLPNPEQLCRELRDGWIIAGIENDYTRMLSRQIYTYGVIYNATGNVDALEFMQIGVEQLLERFEDNESVATILKQGEPLLAPEQRNAQDLAYVQVGLAMAYYLTGDPALLDKINKLKTYVIKNYYREDWGMLAWTLQDQLPGDSNNQELVAQLDQLNAYMLLLYPHLPEDQKPQWEQDIRLIADILLTKFHIPEDHRFAGQLVRGKYNRPGERHNDFGHSVKTYWMIYTAGQLLADKNYQDIGRTGIDNIIRDAIRFRQQPRGYSHWANQTNSNASSWWEFAELTQATATLAIEDPNYSRYLPDIYQQWLNNFVDKTYGGVWSSSNGGAKQHLWKNGYHEAELGLIALITSQKLKGEPVKLYFARDSGHFQPYLFGFDVVEMTKTDGQMVVTF